MTPAHELLYDYLKAATEQVLASHDKYSAEQIYEADQEILSRDTLANLLTIVETAFELGRLAERTDPQKETA